jgi:hypothetical protein
VLVPGEIRQDTEEENYEIRRNGYTERLRYKEIELRIIQRDKDYKDRFSERQRCEDYRVTHIEIQSSEDKERWRYCTDSETEN